MSASGDMDLNILGGGSTDGATIPDHLLGLLIPQHELLPKAEPGSAHGSNVHSRRSQGSLAYDHRGHPGENWAANMMQAMRTSLQPSGSLFPAAVSSPWIAMQIWQNWSPPAEGDSIESNGAANGHASGPRESLNVTVTEVASGREFFVQVCRRPANARHLVRRAHTAHHMECPCSSGCVHVST